MLSGAYSITAPIGNWRLSWQSDMYTTTTTTIFFAFTKDTSIVGSSSTRNASAISPITWRIRSGSGEDDFTVYKDAFIVATTQDVYKLYTIGGSTGVGFDGDQATPVLISLENAYL